MGEYFSVAFADLKTVRSILWKRNQFRALRMIQTIKQLYFRYKELINYVIIGGLTTVVSLASYYFSLQSFWIRKTHFN